MGDTLSQSELSLYVSAIAASMGDGWSLRQVPDDDGGLSPSRSIDHVDGPSFWLRPDGYRNAKRMEVHGNWPKTSDGREQFPRADYKGEGGANTITFSLSKTPRDAANDIKRRFLPRYMELRAEMLSQVQSADSYAAKTQASIKALIATDPAILRQSIHGDKQDVGLGTGYHGSSLRINGDSVRFEHLDVPLSVALQILPLLKCRPTEDS